MLEAYTTLGYLALATDRIGLGPLVAGVHFRHPAALVKQATTLDVLSGGGRTTLGLGAGWYAREARGLGFPFPPPAERFARLEETLRIARAMLTGDRAPIAGDHYRLDEPINVPPPLSAGSPRILVGGNGPRRTAGLVARYADASNFLNPDPGATIATTGLTYHGKAPGRSCEGRPNVTEGLPKDCPAPSVNSKS